MSKHAKPAAPSDADLRGNPLIGGSKGLGKWRDEEDALEMIDGANTVEGDRENDVNAQGGVDKAQARSAKPEPKGR